MNLGRTLLVASALFGTLACDVDTGDDTAGQEQVSANRVDETAAQQQVDPQSQLDPQAVARAREIARQYGSDTERTEMREQARAEMQGLRFVVDQSDRKLRVYRGGEVVRTHDVAVGTDENPTPTGGFSFNRVDLNPRWVPPDSEWAQDREPQPPGDPDNPMGRARLVYQMPYTIHGTDNLDSLGKAVSHGSIRVANEHVIPLAEMMLKAGGSWEGQQWFQQMTQNRNEEYQIPLESEVTLEIQE